MHVVQEGAAHAGQLDVVFRGSRFVTLASDITVTPTLRDGTYESAELDAWLSVISEDDYVVDVGANVGVFSVLSAKKVGPAGGVTAFEPEPHNIARLRDNIDTNSLDNVDVRAACVGDGDGSIVLYVQPGQSGTHSVMRSRGATPLSVDAVTLDHAITRSPVAAIKIDVEGFEAAVLAGAAETIARDRPTILLEYNGGGALHEILERLMTEGGYDDCRFISRRRQEPLQVADLRGLAAHTGLSNLLLRNSARNSCGAHPGTRQEPT
jgi:FkbM family methyltransferase